MSLSLSLSVAQTGRKGFHFWFIHYLSICNHPFGFPDNWDVRYTLAAGTAAFPTHREDFQISINGTRKPAVASTTSHHHYEVYEANPAFDAHGINKPSTLNIHESVGVHSLQNVPIFASGPGANLFAGIQDNTEIFHKIAEVLGLGN